MEELFETLETAGFDITTTRYTNIIEPISIETLLIPFIVRMNTTSTNIWYHNWR